MPYSPDPKVVQKAVPAAEIVASAELSEYRLNGKMERQASLMLAKALASQVEMLTGQSLSCWRLPDTVVIRRLKPTETRHRLASGEFVVVDKETHQTLIQLSASALRHKCHIMTHVTDRAPTNLGMLRYMLSGCFLTHASFGIFHGVWNSVKNSLRHASKGRPWQCVLGFLVLCNLNYFPFRSSQGFRSKQHALRFYLATHDHKSADFQAIKEEFGKGLAMPCDTEEEEEQLFAKLGEMPSFNEKGPLLKLMRWCSINTCWNYLRSELPGLKLILGQMVSDGIPDIDQRELGTANSIDPAVVTAALKKPGGSLQKAHDWIIPANVFMMDMTDMCTKSLRAQYSFRAAEVKGIQESFACNLKRAKTGLFDELKAIATDAFYDELTLRNLLEIHDPVLGPRGARSCSASRCSFSITGRSMCCRKWTPTRDGPSTLWTRTPRVGCELASQCYATWRFFFGLKNWHIPTRGWHLCSATSAGRTGL